MQRKKHFVILMSIFFSICHASLIRAENLLFPDVSPSLPYYDAVSFLKQTNVINGYPDGTFKPKNTINRAELLKIIVGGTGKIPSPTEYKNCFSDVTNQWFAPYVCYAKQQKWIEGYPDGTFKPEKTVNKVESLKMILNANIKPLTIPESTNLFKDTAIKAWYMPFVTTAFQKGLLDEKKGTMLYPDTPMTRGAISEYIFRTSIIGLKNVATYTSDLKKDVPQLVQLFYKNIQSLKTPQPNNNSPLISMTPVVEAPIIRPPILAPPPVIMAPVFTDVPKKNDNFIAITFLENAKVVQGYEDGTFQPEKPINRAEFAKILVDSKGIIPQLSSYSNCFSDVTTQWFAPYVCYAKSKEWITGYADGTFRPEQPIINAESIKMILKANNIQTTTISVVTNYGDLDPNAWYTPYVLLAIEKNIIDTSVLTFQPDSITTRGEMSEIIFRVIAILAFSEQTFSDTMKSRLQELMNQYYALRQQYQEEIPPPPTNNNTNTIPNINSNAINNNTNDSSSPANNSQTNSSNTTGSANQNNNDVIGPVIPKINVVTTIFPLYDITKKIGGNYVEVSLLTPTNTNPHMYELQPSDITLLEEADIFIYAGTYMDPWVKDLSYSIHNTSLSIIDASLQIELLPTAPSESFTQMYDPHIWMDPIRAQSITNNIANGLGQTLNVKKKYFLDNATHYNQQLETIHTTLTSMLPTCQHTAIVSGGHNYLTYFTKRYNISYHYITRLPPSEEELSSLTQLILEKKLPAVFTEELISNEYAQTIASQTSTILLPLHGGHTRTQEQIDQGFSFLDMFQQNITNLKIGLACQ